MVFVKTVLLAKTARYRNPLMTVPTARLFSGRKNRGHAFGTLSGPRVARLLKLFPYVFEYACAGFTLIHCRRPARPSRCGSVFFQAKPA